MEAIYRVDGANVDTSAFAGGPWDPKLQHGAAPSSLICWAVERLPSAVPMRVARLTVDLMRPVPVAPLTLAVEVLREGKKIQLVSVRLLANGTEVVRATVLRIRREERALPVARLHAAARPARPETCVRPDDRRHGRDAVPVRHLHAGGVKRLVPPCPARPRSGIAPTRPIVEGAPISPLMRAAIAADFCNGTSSVLDFREWTFINGDLTLSLAREPVGEWILLDAETWAGPDSIGLAAARLADRDGYFGRAVQSILFEKRS